MADGTRTPTRESSPDSDLIAAAARAARRELGPDAALHSVAATRGRVLVRADSMRGALAVKVYRDRERLSGEVAAARLAASVGVPVPAHVRFDPGPPAVLVSRWVDGEPVGRHRGLAAQAGRLLRAFHASQRPPPGMADEWATGVRQRSASELRRAAEMGLLSDPERAALASHLERLVSRIGRRPQARIHGDLQPDHVLVDPRAGTITAFLDFADSWFADPLFEVACLSMLDSRLEEPFLSGLGIAADRALLDGYRHLRLLMAATWHVEHDQPAGAASVVGALRDSLT